MFSINIESLKKLKYHLFFKKEESIFKDEESVEILKVIGLINNKEEYQKYIIIPEENINQELDWQK